jgi:ATP synthase protein I
VNDDGSDKPLSPRERRLAQERGARERRRMAEGASIGLEFGIAIALGAWIGSWLDKRYETDPWLLLAGILIGSAAAFRDLIRFARRYEREQEHDNQNE